MDQLSPYNAPPPVVSLEKVEKMRQGIAHLFVVGDTTLDEPQKGFVRYRGRFLVDPADCFDELRAVFEAQGFTPTIREEEKRPYRHRRPPLMCLTHLPPTGA
jgi:hypothetical protein